MRGDEHDVRVQQQGWRELPRVRRRVWPEASSPSSWSLVQRDLIRCINPLRSIDASNGWTRATNASGSMGCGSGGGNGFTSPER